VVDNQAGTEVEVGAASEAEAAGRILVVEDDPLLRRVVVQILQTWGYAILEAPDGLQALEQVREGPADLSLVLLDIMLPLLNGLEVARRVLAERPDLPVVACSAALTDEVVEDLRDAGVRVFLPKPYSPEALQATIAQAATRHRCGGEPAQA
jgi:CheY-like chemotaxis protein